MPVGAVNMVIIKGPHEFVTGTIISTELFNDFKAPAAIFKPPVSLETKIIRSVASKCCRNT